MNGITMVRREPLQWDYLFSVMKTFKDRPACVLPDRAGIAMDKDLLNSYAEFVVKTAHRQGIHALGGMSASIPRV